MACHSFIKHVLPLSLALTMLAVEASPTASEVGYNSPLTDASSYFEARRFGKLPFDERNSWCDRSALNDRSEAGRDTIQHLYDVFETSQVTSKALDYKSALIKSLLFFESQRSGKLPPNQRVTWRGDSAVNDGSTDGVDLSGGYYDAGDNVKFGFPYAFTITMLSWSAVDFVDQLKTNGEYSNLLAAIRWGTDYLIKAHPQPEVLYGQVGDGISDHQCWQRPEDMTTPRPVFKIDAQNPGSDLAGESAAAFAAASIAFKSVDPTYSAELLRHATQLYDFAQTYQGQYENSIPNAGQFYSSSGYKDELVWAAAWLYRATKGNKYLTYMKSADFGGVRSQFSWDDKYIGAQVLISKLMFDGEVSNSGLLAQAVGKNCTVDRKLQDE